jgi:tetrahydromethanopterin S-methyltransferase subunit E
LSKIAFSPNASGTGTFTVAAPNTNTDYTLTLPETTGTLALTTQAITQTTGSAPYYGARAWVNFNGTGTVAIRASGNVSSITDLGTGNYRVNLTTAMPDTNYATLVTGLASGSVNFNTTIQQIVNTSSFEIYTANNTTLTDTPSVYSAVFR